MKFSSLAALEVVILTTSSAANDENFVKMTIFSFQWYIYASLGLNELRIDFLSTSCEIALRWRTQNTFDDKSALFG